MIDVFGQFRIAGHQLGAQAPAKLTRRLVRREQNAGAAGDGQPRKPSFPFGSATELRVRAKPR